MLELKFYVYDNNKRENKLYMQQELICETNWNPQNNNAVVKCSLSKRESEPAEIGESPDYCPVCMFINITEEDAKYTGKVSELISNAFMFMIRVCPDNKK